MEQELNKFIHEAVIGWCWHGPFVYDRSVGDEYQCCAKCKTLYGYAKIEHNPDYCNDLNAVAKAEAKAIAEYGAEAYGRALGDYVTAPGADSRKMRDVDFASATHILSAYMATAPAHIRCQAIASLYGYQVKEG